MPLSKLNQEQLQAATADFGHNLIIASAGTGKTSTIVARIGYLLQNGIKPEEILLLTFTNKAATEMIQRVASYFDKKTASAIEAGTFHAVSYRLLKKMGKNISLKQPKELKILLKSIAEKRSFHRIESSVNPYSASYLYDSYSLYQNSCIDKSYSEWLEKRSSEHKPYAHIYEDILSEFDELKKRFFYVDFNDLLIQMRESLKKSDIFFKEVLIDEYQDTNTLQGSLIEAFKCDSIFCVGDYDQSIYAFNGANINIIATFKQRYKDACVFTLNKNYRSTKQILSLANRVIEKNPRIYPKKLEVTKVDIDIAPKLVIFDELFLQYQGIASMIKQSLTKKDEIAVIFRNNSSADGIEASLREIGISCKRRGGISFFDTKEVKAMLDLFSIIINPKDMMAFIHLFEYARGVGSVVAKEIFDALYNLGEGDIVNGLLKPKDIKNPFGKRVKSYQLGLFDDFSELGSVSRFAKAGFDENFLSNPILKHPKITAEGADFLYAFYTYIKSAKKIKDPKRIIKHVIDSKVFAYIADFLARKRALLKDGTVDEMAKNEAKERIFVKGRLLSDLAKNYNDSERFLNALTLGSSEMSEGEGVNLLSVHASKGLEFKEVYLVDLMAG